jgi:hypothetical protein
MSNGSFERLQLWLSEWNDDKTRQTLLVVLAVLTGLFTGLMVETIMGRVGQFIFPPPPKFGMANTEELKALLAAMPVEIYLIKILSWALGALGGGYVAARMAKIGPMAALLCAILLTASLMIGLGGEPHPLWVWIVCPLIVLASAYGAGFLAHRVNEDRIIYE